MERCIEKIPSWALSAIINGDYTGLEESDIDLIQRWFEDSGYDIVSPIDADAYFSSYPAFGLACDVYDCVCVIL